MMKKNKMYRFRLALAALLLLQLVAVLYFGGKKTGFHYDEYYSYYSSNVTYGLVPTDREWKDTAEIRSEFMVLPKEGFRFGDVVRMQTYDVHPPLYYLLLHAICSLTPGIFSKWQGLALNLAFFAGSWVLLAMLAQRLSGGRREAALGTCLTYGISPGVISGVMLVRMYTMLGFWVLLVTWLHVEALERRKRGWKFYVLLALTVYLGFLTHYYFAVYLFFLAAAMELYLLFERAEHKSWGQKWKDCICYGIVVVGALLLAVVSYPACLGHIFRGYRGTEAMGAFFDLGNTWGRLRFFAGLLNEYVFGSLLPLLALALVLLGLTLWTLCKTAGKRRTGQLQREERTVQNVAEQERAVQNAAEQESFAERHRTFLIPAAATAGYFAVVAKTALLTAEEANRYQIPIYGMLLMLFVTGLLLLSQKVCGQKAGLLVCGGLTVLLAAGELLGLMRDKVLFLYEEDAPNIAFAKENKAVPTVYFYNGNLMWMIWDESLELMQYDEIYFVNMANTEPVSDETIHEADRVLVYLARNDASEEALRALEAGMAGEVQVRKIRELLYCDLYELTVNGAAAN